MSETVSEEIRLAIEKEQKAIAGDQFYRESLMAVAIKVQQGVYNGYVYEVGADEYKRFKKENPMTPTKKEEKEKKE